MSVLSRGFIHKPNQLKYQSSSDFTEILVDGIKLNELDQHEENLQRQLRVMKQQLREKDQQEENLQRQLRKMKQQLTQLQDQYRERGR